MYAPLNQPAAMPREISNRSRRSEIAPADIHFLIAISQLNPEYLCFSLVTSQFSCVILENFNYFPGGAVKAIVFWIRFIWDINPDPVTNIEPLHWSHTALRRYQTRDRARIDQDLLEELWDRLNYKRNFLPRFYRRISNKTFYSPLQVIAKGGADAFIGHASTCKG